MSQTRVRSGVKDETVVTAWNNTAFKNAREVLDNINAGGYNMTLSALRSRVALLRKQGQTLRYLREPKAVEAAVAAATN